MSRIPPTEFRHEILQHHHRYTFFYSHGTSVVTVTAHHSVVNDWLAGIMSSPPYSRLVVGFGFQWNRQIGLDAEAEVLQLCVADRALIFQLSRAERVPLKLRFFLLNPCCIFVGHNVYSHLPILERSRLRMGRPKPSDIKHLVGPELVNASLQTIAISCCTSYSPRALAKFATMADQEMTDWTADPLSKDQVEAASLYAHTLYTIGCKFYMRKDENFVLADMEVYPVTPIASTMEAENAENCQGAKSTTGPPAQSNDFTSDEGPSGQKRRKVGEAPPTNDPNAPIPQLNEVLSLIS